MIGVTTNGDHGPSTGVYYGGTSVVLQGTGLLRAWPDLQCRFGNMSSAHYDSVRLKWYGDSVVRATASAGTVRCVTPTSTQSGEARLLTITFAPEFTNVTTVHGVGAVATLRGAAFVLGPQHTHVVSPRGAVRLTTAMKRTRQLTRSSGLSTLLLRGFHARPV